MTTNPAVPDCPDPAPTFGAEWRAQAQARPWITIGLIAAVVAVLGLFALSVIQTFNAPSAPGLRLAMVGGLAGLAATAMGALPGIALRRISQRTEDSMLGLAAGMMLAASSFSLILPGLDAGAELAGNRPAGAAMVVLGIGIGVVLMLGLDQLTPHEHLHLGPCGPGNARLNRIWLFVFAITLHNLPEGMAIGVSFSRGEIEVGLPLTSAIAIQDVPEGLAVAMALRGAGLAAGRAVLVAVMTGVMEPLGALLGFGLSSGLPMAYPVAMGVAAGAMIFVVSHEVIPETHRNGHQTPATLGLMSGFSLMMVLDTVLG